MKVLDVKDLSELEEKFAIAIGFFDGVHLGHQLVINNAISYAKENHVKSLVITFDRSPKIVFGTVENEGYLTPIDEKLRILKEMGVDYTLVLKFDATFFNLTADAFINEYLLKIGICYLSVGFDFQFGQGGTGNTDLLLRHGGFKVKVAKPLMMDGDKVSTTRIKNCLKIGALDLVNQMLGRHFSVNGKVVYGRQLGSTIGFPTANIKLNEGYLLSLRGVYATVSYLDDASFMSMTNIGFNPTLNLQESVSIETHIFDFDANIYGKHLRIEFLEKIRDEVRFNNLDELIIQLEKDKNDVNSRST